MRPYTIYIDGKKTKSIKNGKEVRIDVSEGSHTVYLKIDWCMSKPINVQSKIYENVILECYPALRGNRKLISFKSLIKDRSDYIKFNYLNKTGE